MRQAIILIVLALIIIPVVILFQNFGSKTAQQQITKPYLTINGHNLKLELANSTDQKIKGLSGRISLPQDNGMLFIFDKPDIYDFWMKGMKFPLDIIWIYKNKIVTIEDNLEPTAEIDPLKIPRVRSVLPSDTVLEINAGLAKKYNFKINDQVTIAL